MTMKHTTIILLFSVLTAPAFAQVDTPRPQEGTSPDCTDPSGRCNAQHFSKPLTTVPAQSYDSTVSRALGEGPKGPTATPAQPARRSAPTK